MKYKEIYIGYTNNLRRRFELHNSGEVKSTKLKMPWELVYYEAYKIKEDATNREKMLKHDGRSRVWLKKRNPRGLKGAA